MGKYTEIIRYPVIVKPADSNSSNGVKRATNSKELLQYGKEALAYSRNGKVVVEEFISGREINVYCYINDGIVKVLSTNERICVEDGPSKSLKCFAGIVPANLDKSLFIRLEEIAKSISEAFCLNNTAFFFQTIIDGDSIYVVECAPRTGGGLAFFTIKKSTAFDIIEASIDSYLGLPVSFSTWKKPREILAVNTIYCNSGIFDRITGIDRLLSNNTIISYFPYKTRGMKLDGDNPSGGRVGAFVVSGKTKEELIEKVQRVFGEIEVYDDMGNSILRKDLNIFHYPEKVNVGRITE